MGVALSSGHIPQKNGLACLSMHNISHAKQMKGRGHIDPHARLICDVHSNSYVRNYMYMYHETGDSQ